MSQRALAAVDGRVLGLPRNVPKPLSGRAASGTLRLRVGGASGGLFTGCGLSVANHRLEFLPAE